MLIVGTNVSRPLGISIANKDAIHWSLQIDVACGR